MQCSAHALFGTRDLLDTPAPAPTQPPWTPQLVFACPPPLTEDAGSPRACSGLCVAGEVWWPRGPHPCGALAGAAGVRSPSPPPPPPSARGWGRVSGGQGCASSFALRRPSSRNGAAGGGPARSSGPGRGRRPRCPACLCCVSLRSDTQVRACFLLSFSGLLLTGTPEFRLLKNRLVFSF